MLTRARIPAAIAALCLALAALWTLTAAPITHADAPPTLTCPTGWIPGLDVNKKPACVMDQSGTSGGSNGGQGSGVSIVCDSTHHIGYKGKSYLCDIPTSEGDWTFSGGCYLLPLPDADQPPAGDPLWGTGPNSDPNTNRIQHEDCSNIPPTIATSILIPGPCVGTCGARPGNKQTISIALAPTLPEVHMSPTLNAAGTVTGFANQNVWFWLANPLDTAPKDSSDGYGLLALRGTRTFTSIDWRIAGKDKNGNTLPSVDLHCMTANAYTPAAGSGPSPDPQCGYQFTTPGTYTMSVTTSWVLTVVSGNGAPIPPGPLTSPAVNATITIVEGQSTNG